MHIRLLTITHKTPSWIKEGYDEYAKRFPPSFTLELVEIPALKRVAGMDMKQLIERESKKLLAAIKPHHHVIALDVQGKLWSTEAFAKKVAVCQERGRHIDLLIGGPDGLSKECLEKAEEKWSLSTLTFPHFLVRIIVAEQFYRAFSILTHHPYHR